MKYGRCPFVNIVPLVGNEFKENTCTFEIVLFNFQHWPLKRMAQAQVTSAKPSNFLGAYIIFCALYELTIGFSGLDFELIDKSWVGKRGETNNKLHNRWHTFESELNPKSKDYMTVMENSLSNVSAKHGKDALE